LQKLRTERWTRIPAQIYVDAPFEDEDDDEDEDEMLELVRCRETIDPFESFHTFRQPGSIARHFSCLP
jgi:hypothetical protein